MAVKAFAMGASDRNSRMLAAFFHVIKVLIKAGFGISFIFIAGGFRFLTEQEKQISIKIMFIFYCIYILWTRNIQRKNVKPM